METVLIYLVKSAGLLAVFYSFYFFLLRKDQSFNSNRNFLTGGLLTSAILPSIYFTKKIFVEAPATPFQMIEGNFVVTEVSAQEPLISPLQILMALYLLGVAVMTVRISIQLISLFRVIYSGRSFAFGGIKYVETSEKVAPFSFLNYVVYNPRLHSETELEHILKHENAHVVQWHSADVLLANLNLIYQWFNPFAWFYLNSLQQNLEYIADEQAVKEVACKKEYQKALVKISVNNFNAALTNSFYQSFIKKRIVMLNKNTTPKNNYWKICLVFPLMLAFLLLFNVRTVAQVKENNSEAETQTGSLVSSENEILLEIDKNTSREQLEDHSNYLKQYNVDLQFEDLEYNDAGLLTDISASFLDKNANTRGSLSRSSEKGITPFTFTYSPKNGSDFNSVSQDTSTRIVVRASKTDSSKIVQNGFLLNDETEGKNPIYILNGEKIDKVTAESLKASEIQNVTVLKGANATSVYGRSAKDGAVVFSSKPGSKVVIRSLTSDPLAQGEMKDLYNDVISGKKDPLIVIDGEVQKKSFDLRTLNMNKVASINFIPGDDLKKEYGRRAKDGILNITTRSKTERASDNNFRAVTVNNYSYSESPKMRISSNSVGSGTSNMDSISPNIYIARRNEQRAKVIRNGKREDHVIYIDSINYNARDYNASQFTTRTSPPNTTFYLNSKNSPLFVVDGREMPGDFDRGSIDQEQIASIVVLKDKTATEKYGEKGTNGVIEITTKKEGTPGIIPLSKIAVITANSTSEEMETIKKQLKETANLDVSFEGIKRNSQGLIMAIKAIARTKGQEIFGTYIETEKISDIYIGVRNGKIIMTSNPTKL